MAKSRENLKNHIREHGCLFNFDGTGHGATDEQRLDSPTRHRFTSQAHSAIEVGRPLKPITLMHEPEEREAHRLASEPAEEPQLRFLLGHTHHFRHGRDACPHLAPPVVAQRTRPLQGAAATSAR